jgi:dihydrofolate reductase
VRKLIVTEFISIDGVVGEPHEWHFPFWSDEMGAYKQKEVFSHDGLVLGRNTYDGFAAAWPAYEDEDGFADRMNGMPKYVVSTTLTDPAWNNTSVIQGDVVAALNDLKAQEGQDLMIAGSVSLINSLVERGVIDEYRLMVHPVVVGKGLRMWQDRETPASFGLASVEHLPNGVMVVTYVPRASESATPHPYADQGGTAS